MLALGPFIDDMPCELAILLAGLLLFEPARPGRVISVTALLAFISLIKGTHLLLALCTLAWRSGFMPGTAGGAPPWIGGRVPSSFLLLWLFAGQSARNIPAFLGGILSLSSGYNEAMSLEEPAGVFWRGLLALTLLSAGIAWGGWQRRREPAVVAGALLLGGFTFVL